MQKHTLACALAAALVADAHGSFESQNLSHADLVVTNCDDHGPGSLRDAVLTAASGDAIDLTGLACGTISLSTGAIEIAVPEISLLGPGADALIIDANFADRVVHQGVAGSLALYDLTLAHGSSYEPSLRTNASGGCVYAKGDLSLTRTIVTTCTVYAPVASLAGGGAVFAGGDLDLESSTITHSVAQGFNAAGGGAFAYGNIAARYSTISFNLEVSPDEYMRGGGLLADGYAYLFGSTVSYNTAGCGGGVDVVYGATIVDSTISGNVAQIYGGGIDDFANFVTISNSTIAFNGAEYGGGIIVGRRSFGLPPHVADVESSIIANNSARLNPDSADLLLGRTDARVTGAYDLIVSAQVVPPGTLRADPMLKPLDDYGGPTMVLALDPRSQAIDRGSDFAKTAYDQRGPGFARIVGKGADIGAYEVQIVDAIFSDGFDDAPSLKAATS